MGGRGKTMEECNDVDWRLLEGVQGSKKVCGKGESGKGKRRVSGIR